MRLRINRTVQMKKSEKLSNSPGARQDRRGLDLNGEWPPRMSTSFLEGHAPLVPSVAPRLALPTNPSPRLSVSWLDQKVGHGVDALPISSALPVPRTTQRK